MTATADAAALRWQCKPFDTLTPRELQNIHRARQWVFVVEQHCAYLDADGLDEGALHLAAWHPEHAVPWAYARIVAPGAKYQEPSIGRVLTWGPGRGNGLGRELMRRAIEACIGAHPGQAIRISAQAHLAGFYGSLGFAGVGDTYLEDGIPHVEMLRPPGAALASPPGPVPTSPT